MSEQTTTPRPAPPSWSPWAILAIIMLVPALVIFGIEGLSHATGLREDPKKEESHSPAEDEAHDESADASHSDDEADEDHSED